MTQAPDLRPFARGPISGRGRAANDGTLLSAAGPRASGRLGLAAASALLPLIGLALACLDGVALFAADHVAARLMSVAGCLL
ncbi:MAG: hypothetical protein DI565_13245 [Ancylobacter novellus]|uniref:Uncharacterized protein n=1 Tax=Ancylobacter novellus TaxID=921 RepID=A0A2W5KF44_ANCNO|nr:MAG: hypothetical protein DI565_13245 [Ancylobacter novellus]